MANHVVIVESPAKAKTINKYLGDDFTVLASYGHIRDLPSKNGSVNPDDNFSMTWEMSDRSQKHVDAIKKAVKSAQHVYLATDPDREGEAISWHIHQVLDEAKVLGKKDVKRVVFNEITKNAVQNSFKNPRHIDTTLVEAYLARRALDYLVGFTLSPVLWRKLPGSRSAGRVQSVALRLIVDRESEIERFISQEYWSITGLFEDSQPKSKKTPQIESKLTHYAGKKLDKFFITKQSQAEEILKVVKDLDFHIGRIEKKQVKRNPAAPFITSTLQQEASRKLGFSAVRTMQIAQKLYEGVEIAGETFGLITYMRTDSTNMSGDAIQEARDFLNKKMGEKYVPQSPRQFKTKAKNAQEAHECIRPTRFSLTPEEANPYLDKSQKDLYELIWKRALASQMEQALFDQVSVDITDTSKQHIFRATGSTQIFDGFLKLYQEDTDDVQENDDKEKTLPPLQENQILSLKELTPNQHFTQPPPRYTEASLVKKMEELGIGRPSTYAPILQVLQDRQYVRLEKKQFFPEDRGRIVTSFLIHYFPKYVEYDFTAQLEEELDEISDGQRSWRQVMEIFWHDFKKNIESTSSLTITDVIHSLEKDLTHFLFQSDDPSARVCRVCNKGSLNLKLSRYGAFIGCSEYPECKYTRPLIEGDTDAAVENFENEEKFVGQDPNLNVPIVLRKGPYGYYFEWKNSEDHVESPATPKENEKKSKKGPKKLKPKRVALPSDIDPSKVTLEIALKLSTLPYEIGAHPDDGLIISVGYGRFGPYVKHGTVFASIPKTLDYLCVTLEQALDLLEKKKQKGSVKGRAFVKKSKAK